MVTVGVFNLDYYCGICHSYVNDLPISSFVYTLCYNTEATWAGNKGYVITYTKT